MRALDTYRSARRNAGLRDSAMGFVPRGPAPRYVPYIIKPPVWKYISGVPMLVDRKQPRTYSAGWRTENERAAGTRC